MLPARGNHLAQSLQRSLRSVSRSYAATAPLTEPLEDLDAVAARGQVHGEVKVTKLENGIKVATIDNGGAVSRLSIAVGSGSRSETSSQLGIMHLYKNAAFITNNERSSLRTVREVQQAGGALESSLSRELLSRNATFIRNKLPEILENIAPGITQPIFQVWDLSEVKQASILEKAQVSQDNGAVNLEMLHYSAFRNGLGNSLYCDDLRINNYSPSQFEELASQLHVGERMTIVGHDVNHDELLRNVKDLFGGLPRGQNSSNGAPAKYSGGEAHRNTANGLTYASLVSEGASLFHANLPVLTVLQRLLGSGPYLKWGSNQVSSRLNKAATSVTGDGPLMINALNISYSDSGLFGFHAISTPQTITPVLKAAVHQITSISKEGVSAEDLERAKIQAKAGALMLDESHNDYVDDLVKQIAFSGSYTPIEESVAKIDSVTADQVSQVAKSLLSGKATLAVTGDISSAPHIDQLL